jgi:hypothetical protein
LLYKTYEYCIFDENRREMPILRDWAVVGIFVPVLRIG